MSLADAPASLTMYFLRRPPDLFNRNVTIVLARATTADDRSRNIAHLYTLYLMYRPN